MRKESTSNMEKTQRDRKLSVSRFYIVTFCKRWENSPMKATNFSRVASTVPQHVFNSGHAMPYLFFFNTQCTVLTMALADCWNHRVHRVVTSAFWRTFSHEGKICLGWWGWGVHAHPLLLHLPSPVKLQCTLQLSGQIHWPCFISCKDMYSVVETEVNVGIKEYNRKGLVGFLGWSCRYERILSGIGCSGQPSTK